MSKRKPPVHRPHIPKVRPVPQPVKCQWFGTTPAYSCERTGYRREELELCDLHYAAAHSDPEDWPPEVRRVR